MLRLEGLNVIFTSPTPCTNKHEGEHDDQDKGARWKDNQGEEDDQGLGWGSPTKNVNELRCLSRPKLWAPWAHCKFLHIKKNKGGARPQDDQKALASSVQGKDKHATTPQDD